MKFNKTKKLMILTSAVISLPLAIISCTNESNNNAGKGNSDSKKTDDKNKDKTKKEETPVSKKTKSIPILPVDLKDLTFSNKPIKQDDKEKQLENPTPEKPKDVKPENPGEPQTPPSEGTSNPPAENPKDVKPVNPEKPADSEKPQTPPSEGTSNPPAEKPKPPTSDDENDEDQAIKVDVDAVGLREPIFFQVENIKDKFARTISASDIKIIDQDNKPLDTTNYGITIESLEPTGENEINLKIKYKVYSVKKPSIASPLRISFIDTSKGTFKPYVPPKEPVLSAEENASNYQKAYNEAKKGTLWKVHFRPKGSEFVLIDDKTNREAKEHINDPNFDISKNNKFKVFIGKDPISLKSVAYLILIFDGPNNITLISDRTIATSTYEFAASASETDRNTINLQLNSASKTVTLRYRLYNPHEKDATKKFSEEFTQVLKYA